MKWSTMSSRDRRAVMIGTLVLAPGLLLIWGVRPYRAALSDARDQLATERATLARLLASITPREREVLRMRFEEDMTQAEIGAVIGVSQMQVSRVIRQALARLRAAADVGGPTPA